MAYEKGNQTGFSNEEKRRTQKKKSLCILWTGNITKSATKTLTN